MIVSGWFGCVIFIIQAPQSVVMHRLGRDVSAPVRPLPARQLRVSRAEQDVRCDSAVIHRELQRTVLIQQRGNVRLAVGHVVHHARGVMREVCLRWKAIICASSPACHCLLVYCRVSWNELWLQAYRSCILWCERRRRYNFTSASIDEYEATTSCFTICNVKCAEVGEFSADFNKKIGSARTL